MFKARPYGGVHTWSSILFCFYVEGSQDGGELSLFLWLKVASSSSLFLTLSEEHMYSHPFMHFSGGRWLDRNCNLTVRSISIDIDTVSIILPL